MVRWSRLQPPAAKQPRSLAARPCSVRDSRRNGQLRFRPRPRLAPQLQLRPDAFRALAHSRQPPVPLARALLQHPAVDPFSVVPNPQPEKSRVISDLRLDAAGLGVI